MEKTEEAVATFLAPDKYSRSREHDGRRIEEVHRGWRILNYLAFREVRDAEVRKAQNREAKRKSRATKMAIADSQQCQPMSAQEEEDLDKKKKETLRERESVREAPAHTHTVREGHTLASIRLEFSKRFDQKRGTPPGWSAKAVESLEATLAWVQALHGQEGVLERALDGFFADPWAESKAFPIGAFAGNPSKYLDPPKPEASRNGRPVRAVAAPHEAFDTGMTVEEQMTKRMGGG